MTPEVFAPGIICDSHTQGYPSFTADGNEFYFMRRIDGIDEFVFMKRHNDVWTAPQVVPYSKEYEFWEPSVSPDGTKIFFCSKYLDGKIDESNDLDLWVMEKSDTTWEKPRHLGPDVSTENNEAFPTLSGLGNLYFFRNCKGEQLCDLFVSKFKDGRPGKPQNLGPDVNSPMHDCDPATAFDESCLLFCVRDRKDGLGKNDLYISFKRKDGTWSKSVNMGPDINTEAEEIIPHLTADGEYLFFVSNRSGNYDIYWVSATIIKKLAVERRD
jgi:Tol biopolymer transport system component